MSEIQIIFFIFGLLIGSFLNVLILRLPMGKNVVFPRSACTHCGHVLSWFENIPVLSFLALRGQCRKCQTKISWQYPIVELCTGVMAWFLLSPGLVGFEEFIIAFFKFTVVAVFLVHILIDLRHYLLLDSLNLYLALVFLVYGLIYLPIGGMIFGALIGGGIPYFVTWLFYKIRGVIGLGGGDIKLWSALGLYLGPLGIIYNIWLSCTLGAIVGVIFLKVKKLGKNEPLPFGPSIIIVATIQIIFPNFFREFMGLFLINP